MTRQLAITKRQAKTLLKAAIYRSVDDGSLWVRPREEFEDGRFEPLPAPVIHNPVSVSPVEGETAGLTDAIEWLENHQRQLDQDGIEVAVSRQALEQVLAAIKDLNHA